MYTLNALDAFGFFFKIIAGIFTLFLKAPLQGPVTIGMFILGIVFICFVLNKLFSMTRQEMEYVSEARQKERDMNMGKHAYYHPRHEQVEYQPKHGRK